MSQSVPGIATTPQGATTNGGRSYGSLNSSLRAKFLVLKKIKLFCQKSVPMCFSVDFYC